MLSYYFKPTFVDVHFLLLWYESWSTLTKSRIRTLHNYPFDKGPYQSNPKQSSLPRVAKYLRPSLRSCVCDVCHVMCMCHMQRVNLVSTQSRFAGDFVVPVVIEPFESLAADFSDDSGFELIRFGVTGCIRRRVGRVGRSLGHSCSAASGRRRRRRRRQLSIEPIVVVMMMVLVLLVTSSPSLF